MNNAEFAQEIDDKAWYLMHFKLKFKMPSSRNSLRNKHNTTLYKRPIHSAMIACLKE